jgi:hypothetical protein
MPMPPQLARAKRRRPRHSEPRPTIELMPAININELRHAIPRYHGQVNELDLSLKYPGIARLRLSTFSFEITDYSGRVQRSRIVWIRTGFGRRRASCHCGAIRLFARYGTYACRHCHRALYASQQNNQIGRKRLAACKLRLKLYSPPDISDHPQGSPNGYAAGLISAGVMKSKL